MKQEINPQDSPRGYAFELWKTAGMPKVTIFKTTLPISFQFHHAQMDGFEAARFLNGLQETINGLTIR